MAQCETRQQCNTEPDQQGYYLDPLRDFGHFTVIILVNCGVHSGRSRSGIEYNERHWPRAGSLHDGSTSGTVADSRRVEGGMTHVTVSLTYLMDSSVEDTWEAVFLCVMSRNTNTAPGGTEYPFVSYQR